MVARFYQFFAAAALGLALAIPAQGNRGYLQALGPVPMRFRKALRPPPQLEPMKPKEMLGPELPPDFLRPKVSETATTAPPVAVTAPPAAVTNVVFVPIEPPPHDEIVSPQMLLKYFTTSTNGTTTGVVAPVVAPIDFTPPRPVEHPSSTATYSTTPK